MADAREKILSKFNIDIDNINIINLYKIDSADILPADLETKIAACRKKWNQSINGANEKFAARDRTHLENADKYEKILRDKKLLKEIFLYYKKGENTNVNISFAEEYFKMLDATKKIDKKDVDFFFKYFNNERKNKNDIIEMLKSQYKVFGLGKEEKFASEGEEVSVEGKKKNNNSPLITNLFQEATILKIHKCEQFLENAVTSEEVKKRYPELENGLYEFLSMGEYKELQQFIDDVVKKREEAANNRYDKGQDYVPIVDLFNTLVEITSYKDVVDNFEEFVLLIKYPKLSPYMYSFDEMKPSTLKAFFNIANREYPFRDLSDFILSYFKTIYDNFAILDKGIGSIIKKAEKKAKVNKIFKAVDNTLGIDRTKRVSLFANILHYATYSPIYLLYLIFRVFEFSINLIRKLPILTFIVFFIGANLSAGDENLLSIRYLFFEKSRISVLDSFIGEIGNGFETLMASLCFVLMKALTFIAPPAIISCWIHDFSEKLCMSIDWIGLKRTYKEIFKMLKAKTEKQYKESKKKFAKKKITSIIMNLICVILLCLVVYLLAIGISWIGDKMKDSANEYSNEYDAESNTTVVNKENMTEKVDDVYMIIVVKEANIRTGIGTSCDVITVVRKDNLFLWTGNQGVDEKGKNWYEIYIDQSKTKIGWASEEVIKFADN